MTEKDALALLAEAIRAADHDDPGIFGMVDISDPAADDAARAILAADPSLFDEVRQQGARSAKRVVDTAIAFLATVKISAHLYPSVPEAEALAEAITDWQRLAEPPADEASEQDTHCTNCGQLLSAWACGPIHAMVRARRGIEWDGTGP